MVVSIAGIARLVVLVDGDIYKCQAGTGTTAPTSSDTALETPDSNTLATVTTSTATGAIQVTFQIDSVTGATNAYSEQETQINLGSTMLNRIVHTAVTKGSADEFNYITNWFIKSI